MCPPCCEDGETWGDISHRPYLCRRRLGPPSSPGTLAHHGIQPRYSETHLESSHPVLAPHHTIGVSRLPPPSGGGGVRKAAGSSIASGHAPHPSPSLPPAGYDAAPGKGSAAAAITVWDLTDRPPAPHADGKGPGGGVDPRGEPPSPSAKRIGECGDGLL